MDNHLSRLGYRGRYSAYWAYMRCEVFQGDITTLAVDAIVNAANTSLLGGGGVDGAIHSVAGPDLLDASKDLAPCPHGNAVITDGFNLPARFVIHAVGPIFRDGTHGESNILARTYQSSLELALEHKLETVAFPCISTGAYRFPKYEAAKIAISSIADWQANHPHPACVVFCCYDRKNFEIYSEQIHEWHESNGGESN